MSQCHQQHFQVGLTKWCPETQINAVKTQKKRNADVQMLRKGTEISYCGEQVHESDQQALNLDHSSSQFSSLAWVTSFFYIFVFS